MYSPQQYYHEQQHQQQVLMAQQQQVHDPNQIVVIQTTTTTYHHEQQPMMYHQQADQYNNNMYYGQYMPNYGSVINHSSNYDQPQSLDALPFFSTSELSTTSNNNSNNYVPPPLFQFDNLNVDALVQPSIYLPTASITTTQQDQVKNNTTITNNNNTKVDNVVNTTTTTNLVNNNTMIVNKEIKSIDSTANVKNTQVVHTQQNNINNNNQVNNNNTTNLIGTTTQCNQVINNTTINTKVDNVVNTNHNTVIVNKEIKSIDSTQVVHAQQNNIVNNQVINNNTTNLIGTTTQCNQVINNKTITNNTKVDNVVNTTNTTNHVNNRTIIVNKDIKNTDNTSTNVVNSTLEKNTIVQNQQINNQVINNNVTLTTNNVQYNTTITHNNTSVVNKEALIVQQTQNKTVVESDRKLNDKSTATDATKSIINNVSLNTTTTNTTNISTTNTNTTNNVVTTTTNINTTIETNSDNKTNCLTNTTDCTNKKQDGEKREPQSTENKWVIEATISNFKTNYSHLSGVSPLYSSTIQTLEKYQANLLKTLELATGDNSHKFMTLAKQIDSEFEKNMGWFTRTVVMLEREKMAFMNWTDNPNIPKFMSMTVEELIEECKKLPSDPKFDASVKTLIEYFQKYGKLVQYLVLLRHYYISIHKKYDAPKVVLERGTKCGVSRMYNDNDFDFTIDSLKVNVAYWLRPCQFSDKPVLIGDAGLDVKNVRKGFINNAYFISALHAISSSRPDLLKNCFIEQDFATGRHTVRLYNSNGHQKFVSIDDSIPIEYLGKPIGAFSSNPNEFWVHLLEKAYAKQLGGYHKYCHGGRPQDALQTLVGAKTSYECQLGATCDVSAVWAKVLSEFNNGHLLLVSNNKGYNEITENDVHSYIVQQVVEVEDDNKVVHKLVKLFNPWGFAYSSNEQLTEKAYACMEWKGKYSDNDKSSWNESLLKKLNVKSANDGVFWMCSEDFCHHWTQVVSVSLPPSK